MGYYEFDPSTFTTEDALEEAYIYAAEVKTLNARLKAIKEHKDNFSQSRAIEWVQELDRILEGSP